MEIAESNENMHATSTDAVVAQPVPSKNWLGRCTIENIVTVLVCCLVAAFHANVHEDRLLLNLYYVGIAAAMYSLIRRGCYAQFAFVSTLVAGTTVAHVYAATSRVNPDPLMDPVIDSVSLTVLLLLSWRLAKGASQFERERRTFELQRELEQNAVRSRAAALTATSHEVRSPLSAILSISEVLIDDCDLNEVQLEFVKDIDECGRHLLALINDILDFARTESGQIALQCESVALEGLVEQCLAIADAMNSKSNLKISAQLAPDVDEVYADPLRLKQILLNLLSNAVKYSPDGSVVKVQLRAVDESVHITVRDSGPGISAHKLPHLFDPYYQAAHSDQSVGTGLGLAITKHLVELHNGTIQAESVVGSGTMFTVKLPRAKPESSKNNRQRENEGRWSDVFAKEEIRNAGLNGSKQAYHSETIVIDMD